MKTKKKTNRYREAIHPLRVRFGCTAAQVSGQVDGVLKRNRDLEAELKTAHERNNAQGLELIQLRDYVKALESEKNSPVKERDALKAELEEANLEQREADETVRKAMGAAEPTEPAEPAAAVT